LNALKYAILGLINRNRITGYDLTKIFNDSVADFWSAKQSQIYPELKKLVDAKLVEYEIVIQGEVLEKKVYSITDKGKEELNNWLMQDEPLDNTIKDIFKLRVYFAENLPQAQLLAKFEKQRIKCINKLERYTSKLEEYQHCNITSEDFGDFILLKGAISREKAYIEWIKDCVKYINTK